jgi:hypothetical protein
VCCTASSSRAGTAEQAVLGLAAGFVAAVLLVGRVRGRVWPGPVTKVDDASTLDHYG